jgi:hypothetical protein
VDTLHEVDDDNDILLLLLLLLLEHWEQLRKD